MTEHVVVDDVDDAGPRLIGVIELMELLVYMLGTNAKAGKGVVAGAVAGPQSWPETSQAGGKGSMRQGAAMLMRAVYPAIMRLYLVRRRGGMPDKSSIATVTL